MKKIYLTKEEKQALLLISKKQLDRPKNMSQAAFNYNLIQLQDKDLIWIDIGLNKVNGGGLTKRGKSYITLNPHLRNPFPWMLLIHAATIIAAISATAALFVGCIRLLNM